MPEPVLSPAAAEDAEALAAIWAAGWLDGHSEHVPEALHRHREMDSFGPRVEARIPSTTVARVGDRVVGFVTIHGEEVEQVYVTAEARGTGVAAALLGHAERAIAARHERAWLAVVAGNARARAFYERGGWRDAGPFEYAAEAGAETITITVQRYEKDLRPAR